MSIVPGESPSLDLLSPRHASPQIRDATHSERMYAAWKAIFEAARPSETAPSPLPGSEEQTFGRPAPHSPELSAAIAAQTETARDPRDAPLAISRSVPAAPAADRAAAHAQLSIDGQGGEPLGRLQRVTNVAPTPAATPIRLGNAAASAAVEHASRIAAQPSAFVEKLEPQSVSVIRQGALVSITVRDARLSDEDALHSAFEAARELAGHAAALRQLTVNGRVLYRAMAVQGREPMQPASLLSFAC